MEVFELTLSELDILKIIPKPVERTDLRWFVEFSQRQAPAVLVRKTDSEQKTSAVSISIMNIVWI